jgi:hypothetical protein
MGQHNRIMIGFYIWCYTLPFFKVRSLIYMKTVTVTIYNRSSNKKNQFNSCFNNHHLKWLF